MPRQQVGCSKPRYRNTVELAVQGETRWRARMLAFAVAFLLALSMCGIGVIPTKMAYAVDAESGYQPTTRAASLTSKAKISPKISKKTVKLKYGKSTTIKVSGNAGKKIVWKSSNKKIVTVKATGPAKAKVVARGSGKATITAKVGKKKLTCKVVVPFSPKISAKTLDLTYGKSKSLKVSGANEKTVTWKSSNEKVATVQSKGTAKAKVVAKRSGKATISAKVGNKTLKCTVKVVGVLNKKSVSLSSFETGKLELRGGTAKSWTSSNVKYVKVDGNGFLTPGGFAGEATVTCTDTVGNTYECTVDTTLPDITCSMDSTLYETLSSSTYYYKKFTFTNRSGKTITLADKLMIYYPYGDSDTSDVLFGLNGGNVAHDLDAYPLTVHSGYYVTFEAFEGKSRYPIYSGEDFGMTITVDSKKYTCLFRTDGAIEVCGPQSS